MAEGGADRDSERKYTLLRTRELVKGRLDERSIETLLDMTGWDKTAAIQMFMTTEPKDLRELLGNHTSEAQLQGIQKDEVLRDLALKDSIKVARRQFTCSKERCKRIWWWNVPLRKQVSKCFKCRTKYEPVPVNREFGRAHFKCLCGNTFSGFGQMNVLGSDCRKCGAVCYPVRIEKRDPAKIPRRPKSRTPHSCNAPDCFSRRNGQYVDQAAHCPHPKSRPPLLYECQPHSSSGSTVSTFLSQEDRESFVSDLDSVREESEPDE